MTLPQTWVPGAPLDIKLSQSDPHAHRFYPGKHMRVGMPFTCTIPARPAPVSAPAARVEGSSRVATETVTPVDAKAKAAAMTKPKTIASWFTAAPAGAGGGGANAQRKRAAAATKATAGADSGAPPASSKGNAENADAAYARRLHAQEVALRGKRELKPLKPPSKRQKKSTGAAGRKGRSGQLPVIDLTSSPVPPLKRQTMGAQQSMLSFFGKR